MAVDIKQVSRGVLEEVFSKGRLDYLDKVCDASFKAHDPLTGQQDVAGLKRDAEMYRAAFPDLTATVVGICAEGDSVCVMWRCTGTHQKPFMNVPPTGKKITVEGISFDRFRNGKLVESFAQWDTLGFLQSLGILPRLDLGAPKAEAERRPRV
jgi:steroid delta-isomerase-like uncharacterized protein